MKRKINQKIMKEIILYKKRIFRISNFKRYELKERENKIKDNY